MKKTFFLLLIFTTFLFSETKERLIKELLHLSGLEQSKKALQISINKSINKYENTACDFSFVTALLEKIQQKLNRFDMMSFLEERADKSFTKEELGELLFWYRTTIAYEIVQRETSLLNDMVNSELEVYMDNFRFKEIDEEKKEVMDSIISAYGSIDELIKVSLSIGEYVSIELNKGLPYKRLSTEEMKNGEEELRMVLSPVIHKSYYFIYQTISLKNLKRHHSFLTSEVGKKFVNYNNDSLQTAIKKILKTENR